jgi:hypothetical protein
MSGEYESWRKRAQQYRALAASARSPRAQREYLDLATSAETAAAFHARQARPRTRGVGLRRTWGVAIST